MRIAFLPTGRTEWNGLVDAFRELFPGKHHQFDVLPGEMEIKSFPDNYPYPGFTGNPLTHKQEANPPEAALELVGLAVREASKDKDRDAADLVIVLDDLEPANMHQPDMVARVFRSAVIKHVAGLSSHAMREKTQKKLRERVSFHLLVPMVEALFFADREALRTAGISDNVIDAYPSDLDPEEFAIDDGDYLTATEDACACWKALTIATDRKKKLRPKWLGLPSWWRSQADEHDRIVSWRKAHPKGYLQWLCKDGNQKNCTTYDETKAGGRALSRLSWHKLLTRPDHHFKYLRALIGDVSDMLGVDPVTGKMTGAIADLTNIVRRRPDPVLRNL